MPDSFLGLLRFRRVMAGRVAGREAPKFLGFAVDDGEVDIGEADKPIAGFGLGFERTLAYVTGLANVRDAIPFPRTPGNARY